MPVPMLRKKSALAAAVLFGALLAASIVATSGRPNAKAKAEFMRAMQQASKEHPLPFSSQHDRKSRRDRLRKNLLAKAIPVPRPSGTSENEEPDFMKVGKVSTPHRRLDGGNNNNNADEEEPDWGEFGFDVSDLSVKYVGCSAVSMYSDELAEQNTGSVFETMRFAVFRLCPSDSCSDSNFYGCNSYYGEYILPMADYLEEFSRYREEAFEQYCNYCDQCMYFEKYFYGNRELDEEDAGDDGADEDAGDDAAAEQESHACKYYTACSTYADVCDVDDGDDENDQNNNQNQDENDDGYIEFEYEEFFECQEFDGGDDDGNSIYLGPYCDSDRKTITIGVFSDELCSTYVGDQVDIVTYTGIQFEYDGLADYYSEQCIPCRESDLPYNIPERDQEDEDDITELCEGLYVASAKCNLHLDGATDASYESYAQQANEKAVCTFIENVVKGNYDESGFIYIDSEEYEEGNKNNVFAQKIKTEEEVTSGQVFGLIVFGLGSLIMLGAACYIHKALIDAKKAASQPVFLKRTSSDVLLAARASFD